jgi:hypothetical protein
VDVTNQYQLVGRRNFMTTNQFNYMQLAQTALRDAQNYAIAQGQLRETIRHQKTTESIDRGKLDESVRHNLVAEQLQHQSNQITDWYNQRMATINTMNALTNRRQAETQRTKVENEYQLGRRNASSNEMNALTNQFAADAKATSDRIAANARMVTAKATKARYEDESLNQDVRTGLKFWDTVISAFKLF